MSVGSSRMGSKNRRRRRRSIIRRDGYRCRHCGTSSVDLTLDHVVPLVAGGANAISNLQLLCRPCNSAKGSRVPKEAAA